MTSIYPLWFRSLCAFVRLFFRKLEVQGSENIQSPCVIVTRHLNNYGPAAAYLFSPAEFHLWTYYVFTEPKAFGKHVVDYTYTKRVGMKRPLAKVVAQIVKHPAAWAYRAIGMIPVYRGSRDVLKTMELSLQSLEKDENILIFPDVDYIDDRKELGEIYTGFIKLGRMFYKRTGKRLRFQPMSVNREGRYIRFGKPIVYDPEASVYSECERIVSILRDELKDNRRVLCKE